jgi:single-strand DNA-binding protein
MPDLNRVFLLGRLTRDPSLRHTPGGTPVAEFGIAVNRTWSGPDGDRKEETCFVDIVVWARRAEICHSNLRKGSPVFLEGRLHLDTWESQGGEKRSRLKVVANNVIFLNPAQRGSRGGGGRSDRQRKAEASPPEDAVETREEPGEADFPF